MDTLTSKGLSIDTPWRVLAYVLLMNPFSTERPGLAMHMVGVDAILEDEIGAVDARVMKEGLDEGVGLGRELIVLAFFSCR